MGSVEFPGFLLRFGAEDFFLLSVSFVLILIWRDLEWCTGCLALHVFVLDSFL